MIHKSLSLFLLIILFTTHSSFAASSGDEGGNPGSPSGSGGGGGGSPQFFDYYIPLVFNNSHRDGQSEVTIWLAQPSAVITSFAQDKSGTNINEYQTPIELTFNPKDNAGLTNGSLIRTTTPALVVGKRETQDIYSDTSFAYSVLSDKMMGFEFIAPEDGYFNILSSTIQVEIHVDDPRNTAVLTQTIGRPYTTTQIKVSKGTYLNSTGPMAGAFISYNKGTFASMAVPDYLKGDNYIFDGDASAPREDEINLSHISIIPEEPTELLFIYDGKETKTKTIFGNTEFILDPQLRGINSSRGKIHVSIQMEFIYGNITRKSLVQLFAANEMRAAEVFASPYGYSTHFGVSSKLNELNSYFFYEDQNPDYTGYYQQTKRSIYAVKYDKYSILNTQFFEIMVGEDALYSFITSPGMVGNPMSPSLSFNNIPLNSQTGKNITGLEATWYRSPNIAVGRIDIVPGPVEEYTGAQIQIEIYSNGSLPASHFKVKIQIDDEEPLEQEFDFIAANETILFTFDRFLDLGKKAMNITVDVDIDDEVNEINEEDNSSRLDINVAPNIRLRFTFIFVITLISAFAFWNLRKWLKRQKQISRTEVDVLIDEVIIE